MAVRKSTTAAKSAPAKAEQLTNKEIVLKKHKKAECLPVKTGFSVVDQVDDGSPVHAGLAKSEDDAWKLAAHAVL